MKTLPIRVSFVPINTAGSIAYDFDKLGHLLACYVLKWILVIGKLIAAHLIIRLVCQAPPPRPIKKGPLNVKRKMKFRQEVGGGVKSTSGWKGMYHCD